MMSSGSVGNFADPTILMDSKSAEEILICGEQQKTSSGANPANHIMDSSNQQIGDDADHGIANQNLSMIVDIPIPLTQGVGADLYRDARDRRRSSSSSRSSLKSSTGSTGELMSSTDCSSAKQSHADTNHTGNAASVVSGNKSSQNGKKRRSSGNDSATGYQTRKSMWNNLVKNDRVWEEDSDEKPKGKVNLVNSLRNTGATLRMGIKEKLYILKNHPWILLLTLFVFGCLFAIGLYVVLSLAHEQEQASRDEARDLATRTASWFSDALDRALLPVFALSRLVEQLDMFATIPEEIGAAFHTGSLPFLPPEEAGGFMRRNMTGTSCSDAEKIERFNNIAATIKRGAKMEGILVNLQVAPLAVVCYAYPLVNTEDFEPPKVLNSTEIIGLDNLAESKRSASAKETIQSDGVVIAGPLTLRQCTDCDPTVKTAFIAWVTIDSLTENQVIKIDGIDHNKWGFATALINWAELVNRSDVNEKFIEKGLNYQLTRTDEVYNDQTREFESKVNILAGDEEFACDEINTESVDINTANNVWNIKVGKSEGFVPCWKKKSIAAAFVGAFIVSFMLMIICIESQSHHDLLRDMLPPKALRKIKNYKTCVEKYEIATVFFSEIVGYTAMSAEMSAIQIMKTLNEFYTELDKIADKHKVYKIQTIGDGYMVTGGVPDRCSGHHGATNVALFAIEAMEFVETFRTTDGAKVVIRAGINSGPLVAGVVGTKRPQYTVFGDTVNVAARMETTSRDMRIQCSDATCQLLRMSSSHLFFLEKRGTVAVKGKGDMNAWFIVGAADICNENDASTSLCV